MISELIPVQLSKILQSRVYTAFILEGKGKQFVIYTAPHVGKNCQDPFIAQIKGRPSTYHLINSIFDGLNIKILQVVITDVQDSLYFAHLFVEQEKDGLRNILEIDARPSDCLSLAIEEDIPIYCTKEAFDKTIALDD